MTKIYVISIGVLNIMAVIYLLFLFLLKKGGGRSKYYGVDKLNPLSYFQFPLVRGFKVLWPQSIEFHPILNSC